MKKGGTKVKCLSLPSNLNKLFILLAIIFISFSCNEDNQISMEELNLILASGFKELGVNDEKVWVLNEMDSLIAVKRNLSTQWTQIESAGYLSYDSTKIQYLNRILSCGFDDFQFFKGWRKGEMQRLLKEVTWTQNHRVFELSEIALIGIAQDTIYFEVRQRSFAGRGDCFWFIRLKDEWVLYKTENLYLN